MAKKKEKVLTPEQQEEIRTKDFFDCILPGTIKFHTDYYIIGDSFRSVWALKEYPPTTEEQAILSQLGDRNGVTLRIYHRLVESFEQRKIMQNATRANKLKTGGTDVNDTIEAEGNLQDVIQLMANLRKNKEILLHCCVFIELKAKTLKKLRDLQSDITMELTRSKLSVDKLTLRQKEGFLSVLPVGSNQFGAQFERVLPSSSVANLYPFNFSGKTDPKGLYIGRDKFGTNILVDFDRRAEDKTTSNILILGNSGQGKSYLLKLILTNIRESGKSIICLDPEAEYEEICSALGGTYIDFMSGDSIINPLEPKAWTDGSGEIDIDTPEAFKKVTRLSQHIAFLKDFFRSYKDFSDAHIDTIELMLIKLYNRFGITDTTDYSLLKSTDYPTMSDFYDLCEKEYKTFDGSIKPLYSENILREVCLGLNSMCIGAESKYFNGYTNINDSEFLVFGVKGLMDTNKKLKDALLFNILSYMSNQLLGKGSTAASIDETEIITVDDDDMLHVTLFFDDTTYEWHVEPKIDFNLEYRGETDPSFTWTGEAVFIKKPDQDSFDSDIDMTGAELSIELDIPDKNISEHRTLIFGDNFEEQFNDEEYKTLVYSFTGYSEGDYSIYIDDINANYFYMSVFLNLKSGDSLLINMEDVRFPFSKTSFINAAEEEGLIIGDASLDQSVNVTDASIIQLITASSIMPTLAQQYCADVNGDRIVDIIDATFVQMYTANKISIFPAEEKENSSITVNSTSNFFGDDSCIVDASDDKVTLTYYLNIPAKEMVNAQWYLYYDSNILKFDDSNGSIGDFEEYTDSVFCGAPKRVYCEDYGSSSTTMVTIKKDKIIGTTSEDANSYPLSLDGKEIPFISVTFKILDNTARETSVSLDMYVMSLKANNALGFSYFINDSKIVNNSVVYQSRTDIYSGGENKRCLLLSDCIENDSFDYGFNAWEHVEENTRILSALVCEDAYAEGASLRFGTYLFHANCEDVDLKQLIGKRINARGVFCSQATEVGNDNDHYDIVDEIEFTISDLEIVDGKEESVSYMVIDSEFDADEFIVGRMYEFDNAQIEFTDSAFDILHYDTLDDTVLCHFNYTISSQYYFNHSEIEKQYNNQQLICFGVCRGMESKKYIDIIYIDNE